MKDNSTTLTQLGFPNSQTISMKAGLFQATQTCIKKRKKHLLELMQTVGAIMGIGCIFFVSIYLFFIQLANYGWQ